MVIDEEFLSYNFESENSKINKENAEYTQEGIDSKKKFLEEEIYMVDTKKLNYENNSENKITKKEFLEDVKFLSQTNDLNKNNQNDENNFKINLNNLEEEKLNFQEKENIINKVNSLENICISPNVNIEMNISNKSIEKCCPICYGNINKIIVPLKCNHECCSFCLEAYLKEKICSSEVKIIEKII